MVRQRKRAQKVTLPESEEERSSSAEDTGSEGEAGSLGHHVTDLEEESEDDNDADAPRVAQWVDEEELEEEAEEEEEEEEADAVPAKKANDMDSLRESLSSLPFGALRKAQRALAQTVADTDSEGDDSQDEESGSEREPSSSRVRLDTHTKEDKEREKKRPPKRSNKHAPTEVTSKRTVSRRRTVVEVPKMEVRDPRFMSLAGEYDPTRFQNQYGFLFEMHETELKTLRDNLKRARKLLASSPGNLREAREREVERLELAVKRAESIVNKERRERAEHDALRRAAREEKEKRQQGKQSYWMKDAEKKKLLVKARYEAVAARGGKGAVKRAIERKQKKMSQKETKSRPFPRSSVGRPEGGSAKRRSFGQDEGPSRKRRKAN
ncbi:DUF947-domain-containing protein [Dentipellis sp. KUC8613]|nr:DUF947-domain-containing protein [Dentipellis sp. KUC8613]